MVRYSPSARGTTTPEHSLGLHASGLSASVRSAQVNELRETSQNSIHDSKAPVRLQLYGQKGPVCVSHKHIFILLSNPLCSHELQDTWDLSPRHPEMCVRTKPWRAFLMPTLTPTTPSAGEHPCTRAAQGLGSAKSHPVCEHRRSIIT